MALVYDGTTHAVMMASPADLEDFALGFSLTEGKVAGPAEIAELEIVEHANGIEARMWLAPEAARRDVAERRRRDARADRLRALRDRQPGGGAARGAGGRRTARR